MEDNLYYPGTLYFNKDTSVFQYKNNIEKRWTRDEGIGKIQWVDTDSIGRLVIRAMNIARKLLYLLGHLSTMVSQVLY